MTVAWLRQDAADVPADLAWLTPAERVRLAGLRVPARRRDWLLGRWTAKRLLGASLGTAATPLAPARIEIRAAADGAPEPFVDGRPVPWTLSLSHRAGRGLCAVAPGPAALGCDLEPIEPRDPALVADYFTDPERALVAAATPADRVRLVVLLWSAKESALKAMRAGLREDPRDVVIVPSRAAPVTAWQALAARHEPGDRSFAGWWRALDGDVLTVVVAPDRLAAGIRTGSA